MNQGEGTRGTRAFLARSSRVPRAFLARSSRVPRAFLARSSRVPRAFLARSSRVPRDRRAIDAFPGRDRRVSGAQVCESTRETRGPSWDPRTTRTTKTTTGQRFLIGYCFSTCLKTVDRYSFPIMAKPMF